MAKVTITFEDGPDDNINVTTRFRPSIKRGEVGTAAQHFALQMLNSVAEQIRAKQQENQDGQSDDHD